MGKRWDQFKHTTYNTVDGEPGSIFWAVKMGYRGTKRAVEGINGWLAVRRVEKAQREREQADAEFDAEFADEPEVEVAEDESAADEIERSE